MDETAAENLIEFVRGEAGEGLRALAIESEDGYAIEYLRNDLRQKYDEHSYSETIDHFRAEAPTGRSDLGDNPIGPSRALVHYHEHACIIQVPLSGSRTLWISVSRDVATALSTFVESCREIVLEQD